MQVAKKQDFLKGAAILAAASIFVKIVGAIYKIPIFNVLDDAGIGFFQVTYNVYTLILTIATYGIPVALSRMVSSACANGDNMLVKRYFSVALPAFAIIGVVAMAVMFFFADFFAGLMNNAPAAYGIRVLAPAVFFVCIISVYRGYMQGFQNMIPTAASQVVEVVCKAAFGIVAALWLTSMGFRPYIVSAGALTGVTVGLGLSVPLLIWYKRKFSHLTATDGDASALPSRASVFGKLMKVSLPITIGASFMTIMVVIDSSIVLGRMQWVFSTMDNVLISRLSELSLDDLENLFANLSSVNYESLLAQSATINIEDLLAGLSSADFDKLLTDLSSRQFGIYARGLTIYNLPSALIVPVAVSAVPAIAAAIAKSRYNGEAVSIMQSAVKLVALVAMPAAIGIMVLANPILVALYNDPRQLTTTVLIILGAASFFVCFQLITTAILQANGRERLAMIAFPIGALIKITLGYILVGNPDIGIIGSPLGTLACFIALSVINVIFILTKLEERPKFAKVLLKPLLCSAFMAGCAFFLYKLIAAIGSGFIGEGRMAVMIFLAGTIMLSVVLYGVMIIITRTITIDDMKLLPKGDKLAKLLKIQ